MEPATAMPASPVPTLQRESTALRARRLAAARRRATALLVGATALFDMRAGAHLIAADCGKRALSRYSASLTACEISPVASLLDCERLEEGPDEPLLG